MNNCPVCKGPMKELLHPKYYCPNDCDLALRGIGVDNDPAKQGANVVGNHVKQGANSSASLSLTTPVTYWTRRSLYTLGKLIATRFYVLNKPIHKSCLEINIIGDFTASTPLITKTVEISPGPAGVRIVLANSPTIPATQSLGATTGRMSSKKSVATYVNHINVGPGDYDALDMALSIIKGQNYTPQLERLYPKIINTVILDQNRDLHIILKKGYSQTDLPALLIGVTSVVRIFGGQVVLKDTRVKKNTTATP